MSTMTVKDAAGLPTTIEKPLSPGRVGAANARPVVLSSEDSTALNSLASQATLAALLAAQLAAPPVTLATATIVFGDATGLSNAIDCTAGRLARIDMPSVWTAAALTLQVSEDNTQFFDFYKADGTEYSVVAAANHAILVPLIDFRSVRYLKIRSGTSAVPVTQTTTSRILKLSLVA